ncbi:hypothetical protein HOLleu_26044 [Holothuria leucospilota]|uniref:Uncharacterized protein n=1 Tax=Holothuria leucospilota TaxID=206669 RepID=A0A9Q1BTI7_HOLLE|nr:hypothetical protein HOLleu_26044 [Holothuria leucospilota]
MSTSQLSAQNGKQEEPGSARKVMTLDPLGEEGELSDDESLDEEIDFKPPQADSNKFEMLCDGLMSALSLLQSSLAEFLLLKDELVQHALPPSLLARTAMVSGRVFRSATDLYTPASELVRLVRVYSTSWEEKSAALKKLHSDYDSKHKQLNIAIRRLQLIDAQARRMAKERRIMMWEKLFSKLTSARGHGRRWKFLIDNFKQKSKLGMEHLQAYIDSLDKEPESSDDEEDTHDKTDLHDMLSQSNSVNELQMISSSDDELDFSEDSSDGDEGDEGEEETGMTQQRTPGGGKVRGQREYLNQRVTFQEPDKPPDEADNAEPPKTVYVEVPAPKPPTSEKGMWTHEPQYDYYLNVKVYQPLGITLSDVKCSLTIQQQFQKSEPFPEEKPESGGKGGKGTGKAPSPVKGNTLIGSRGAGTNSQQKKRSVAKPGDRHFILTFPTGDKPLIDKNSEEAKTESETKPEEKPSFLHPPKKPETGESETEDEDETQSEKSGASEGKPPPREEPIKLGVHHGQFDELVAMGAIVFEDLKTLDIQLVESVEDTKQFTPTPFPVYKIQTGRKVSKTPEDPTGALPLVFFYTRVHKPFVKEKATESETLKEIVLDLTGVDLRIMKKEDLSINKKYEERCLSAMSVQSSQSEKEDVIPKADFDIMMEHHEEELKIIQIEYEKRIQDLTDALEQLQNEHMNALLNPKLGEGDAKSPLQGWNGEGNNEEYTRLPDGTILTHVKKYKTPANIPKWGSDLPNDFLERLELFTEESQKRRQQLTEKTRKEIQDRLEKQLAVQYKLSLPKGSRRAMLKDVSLPAVFMPSRTGQLYNPRAHQYFHATGSLGQLRLTQPPSIFQLPPLPNKNRMSVLNLFDIRKNFAWQEEGGDAVSRATTVTPSRVGSLQHPMTPNTNHKVGFNPAPPNTAD